MSSRFTKWIVNEFLYSGHIQSLGASSVVYTAAILSGFPVTLGLVALPYFIFQAIYSYDRYRDIDKDLVTNFERTEHLRKYHRFVPFLIAVFTIVIFVALLKNVMALLFSSAIIALGFLYPIFFKGLTRYVFLFKNFYVSFVFALITFFPIFYFSESFKFNVSLLTFSVYVLLELLIVQIVLDIKDRKSDRGVGLRTLPAVIGKGKTLITSHILNLIVFLLAVFVLVKFGLPSLFVLLAAVTFIFNAYALCKVSLDERKGGLIAAGKPLLWPFIIAFLK